MPIDYSFLRPESFSEVHRAFVRAFSGYAVDMSYLSEERLLNRAIKNGVSFESSVGAFDGDELVGFMLVGLDSRDGVSGAFDIATGVVPSHQGKGVAKAMLMRAISNLDDRDVKSFKLEVIQENEAAIRAYQSAGFEICRELDCYEISLERQAGARSEKSLVDVALAPQRAAANALAAAEPVALPQVTLHDFSRDLLVRFEGDFDWTPSWENSVTSILRIPDEVIVCGASLGEDNADQLAGAIVYYPALNWVLSLVVRRSFRRRGIGALLMQHLISRISPEVSRLRIMNIDRGDLGMIAFLERHGFSVYVSQYEMELVI